MPTASSSDPRVKRTRRYLQQSVLTLLEKQDLASITVTQITTVAEINRATFYLHFRDLADIVRQTLDTLFEDLVADERVVLNTPLVPDVPPELLVNLFRKVGEHPRLYQRLLAEPGENSFIDRLDRFHEEQFLRHWNDLRLSAGEGESPPAFRARFAAVAIHGAMSWWLEQGQGESAETVAAWLWHRLNPVWYPQGTSQTD